MAVTKTCRSLSELTEQAQRACNLFLDKCKAKGLNVLITETYRSQERQNWLYEQGRSRSGNIVTWTKQSRHTFRRAWDICKNVKGKEYSDANFFKQCGAIAKELGITWGGTWGTPDTPHFEIDVNWQPPKEIDRDLKEAVHKITLSGVDINESSWDDVSKMKMQYVNGLISKLGGIQFINDRITSKGMSFDLEKWKYQIKTGAFNSSNVRSLLIKFARTV